jgi:GH15 family glucan-1,4-alpha-glucosidase
VALPIEDYAIIADTQTAALDKWTELRDTIRKDIMKNGYDSKRRTFTQFYGSDEARETFTRLLSLCNDVGLLSEEYDTEASRLVGNFPQAFSHVPLIDTARTLTAALAPTEARAHVGLKDAGD